MPEQKPIEGSFTEIDDFATMTFSGDKKSDIPEGTFTEVESFTSLPKDLSKDPEFAAIPDLQIPEPDPNIPLKLAAKKTLKDVRDTINATSETILSTGSGILLFGPSKLYGLAALPFGRDAAKRAEEEMMSLGYQPRTPQGKAAADLIAKGFDLFLTPSKMAEEELSKVSPRAGHLLGLGGELVQLALTGTVAKGVKSTVGKGKAPKTSKVAAPLDATLAKDIVQTRRAKTKVAGGERPLKKLSRQEESLAADTAPTRIRQAVETFEAAMEGKLDLPEIGEKLSKQRQRTKIETQVEKDFQKFGKTVFKDTPVKRSEVKQTIKAVEQRDLGLTPKTTEQIAKEAIEELSTQKKSEKAVSDQRKIVQKAIKDIDSDVAAKLAKKSGVKIILKDLNTIFGEKGAVGDIGKMTKEQRIAVKRLESELTKIKGNAAKVNKSVNQYLQDLGTDSAVAKYVDERAQDLPKMVGGINLQRQNIPKTAKEIEKDIADTRLKETITWQDTEKRADQILSQAPEIQKTFKDLKKLSGGEFGAKVEAARVVNAKAQVEAGKLAEDFKDGKIEAKDFNNRMRELDNAISFDIVSDIASEQGRAFNLLKKEISGRRLIKSVREVLDKSDMNARQIELFRKAQRAIDEGTITKEQFDAVIKQMPNPKVMDYLFEYWYNQILSGPPTHLVNFASNTLWMTYQIPHKLHVATLDKIYSSLTGAERKTYLNEIVPMLAGFKKGARTGAKSAGKVIKEGTIQSFESKFVTDVGIESVGAFERSPHKVLRKAAPYVTMVSRALRAMDIWAKTAAFDMEMGAQARKLSNKKLTKKINETGQEFKQRRAELEENFIKKPTEKARQSALDFADHAVFMDKPDPVTGKIISLRNDIPGGKFVVPFVNTISNLTKRGLELTPGLGLIKEAASRSIRKKAGKPISRTGTQVLAKQIEGTVIAYTLINMFELDQITGAVPRAPAEKEAFFRQGKKPWSIKIGNNWVQYRRIEPFNTVLSSVAIAMQKIKEHKEGSKGASELMFELGNSIKDNLIDSSYFQGVQQVFNVHGASRGAFQRFAASWVPYSSFWRSAGRSFEAATEGDVKLREGNEWIKAFDQTIPGLTKLFPGIKPPIKLNVWGEGIVIPGGVLRQWLPWKWSLASDDPVEKELERLGIYPGKPARTVEIDGKKTELDEDIYRSYQTDLGQKLKSKFHEIISTKEYQNRTKNELFEQSLRDLLDSESRSIRRESLDFAKFKQKEKNEK